jgi:glutathione peroxidase
MKVSRRIFMALAAAATVAGQKAQAFAANVLTHKVKDIDGKDVDLSEVYKGKVLLIVNTASKCGLTPQYEGLEKVYRKYKDKGFVILAFPANEFGKQEPGTNPQIKEFCKSNYDVSFPLFEKIVVKGDGIHPLYKQLTSTEGFTGDIQWNFAKFLVGKNGEIVARFKPNEAPESEAVVAAIEKALGN